MHITTRRAAAATVAGAIGLTAAGGLAGAAIGGDGVIHACRKDNGTIRIVEAGSGCRVPEAPMQWNAQGAAGPAGPTGAPGEPGEPGAGLRAWGHVDPEGRRTSGSGFQISRWAVGRYCLEIEGDPPSAILVQPHSSTPITATVAHVLTAAPPCAQHIVLHGAEPGTTVDAAFDLMIG